MRMRVITSASLAIAVACSSAAGSEPPPGNDNPWTWAGPLESGILSPLFQPFLHPRLRGARVAGPGTAEVALYFATSSIYRGGGTADSSLSLTAQTWCGRLDASVGIAGGLELGLETGLYDLEKSLKNEGDLNVYVGYKGVTVADIRRPVSGLSNPAFRARLGLDGSDGGEFPSAALSLVFTIPCAPDSGFARPQGPEFGLFLDLTWEFLRPFYIHCGFGYIREPVLKAAGEGPSLDASDVWFLGLEVEFRATDFMSLHLQFEGMNNPYPRTGNYRLDQNPVQASAGVSLRPSKQLEIFISFSEDLSRTAPDFCAAAGLKLRI